VIGGLGLVLFDSGWVKILSCCEHGSETSVSRKVPRISWLVGELLVTQQGLRNLELVVYGIYSDWFTLVYLCGCGDVGSYGADSRGDVGSRCEGNGNYEDSEDDCGVKVLLSALMRGTRSERETGRRENCQSRNRKSRVNFVLSAQSHCCLKCDCKRSYHAMF
jgi:hypothetical protein